jgi:hypothetical protein
MLNIIKLDGYLLGVSSGNSVDKEGSVIDIDMFKRFIVFHPLMSQILLKFLKSYVST